MKVVVVVVLEVGVMISLLCAKRSFQCFLVESNATSQSLIGAGIFFLSPAVGAPSAERLPARAACCETKLVLNWKDQHLRVNS